MGTNVRRGFGRVLVSVALVVVSTSVAGQRAHASLAPLTISTLIDMPSGASAMTTTGDKLFIGQGIYEVATGRRVATNGRTMSADGRWLVGMDERFMTRTNLVGGEVVAAPSDATPGGIYVTSISRDGSVVAYNRGIDYPRGLVWTLASGAVSLIDDGLPRQDSTAGVRSVSVSADGRFVAFAHSPGTCFNLGIRCPSEAWRYEVSTGNRTRISASSTGGPLEGLVGAPRLSADGRIATFVAGGTAASDQDYVYRKDLSTGELRRIAQLGVSEGASFQAPSISDDGDRIAFLGARLTADNRPISYVPTIYEYSTDSAAELAPRGQDFPVISGDGRTVFFDNLTTFSRHLAHLPRASGPYSRGITAGSSLTVPLTGVSPMASAAVLNVTVTNPTSAGFVTVWPCDQPRPNTSNLNFKAGQDVSNVVIMRPAADTTLCIFSDATTDVIVDLNGVLLPTSSFVGRNPARMLDSRTVSSTPGIKAGGTAVVGPFPADADSVVLNVTATNAASAGFVTVWPCDGPRPNTSNVNYVAGATVPNAVLAKTSAAHTVCLWTDKAADLIADMSGWFPQGPGYHGLSPQRVFDSRIAEKGPQLNAGSIASVIIGAGIPNDAEAVVVNLTGTGASAPGFGTAFPCGQDLPNTSNLNYSKGQTVPNLVIMRPSSTGTSCLFTYADIDYIVDVNGYFPAGSGFLAVTPSRILDTRGS
jgi:hypothetical protein